MKWDFRYSDIRGIPEAEREERLKNLRDYKYVGVDKSFISNHIMNRVWDFFVALFPRWLAPNVITLLGLAVILSAWLVNVFYDCECSGKAPSFVYFNNALCLFLYMMFDATDGKQARRTKSGSPLGQLFDHGVDSIAATLLSFMISSAMGLGISTESLLFLACFKHCCYFASFEEFFTHSFVLGRINGPTEGILTGILFFLISGAFGPSCWSFFLRNDLSPHLTNLSLIGVLFLIVVPPFCVFSSIKNMKTGEHLTIFLHSLVPPIFYICFYIYSRQVDSTFKYYILLLTEIFNFVVILLEMNYAHLTKTEIPICWPSVACFAFLVYFSYRDVFLYVLFLLSFLSFCVISSGIINEICDGLNLCCFSIFNHEKSE